MSWLATLVALLTAVVNATSNVLQRAANRREPPELAMRPKLILHLLRRPLWLAGFAAVLLAFLLQVTALRLGTLAGVQPLIILELPLTLLGAATVLKAKVGRREWLATCGAALGVAVFLVALAPSPGGQGNPSAARWAVAGAGTVTVVAVVTLAGVLARGGRRAALLGLGTGVTFGLTAALMKGMTGRLDHGIGSVLTAWQTYSMIAAGLLGMFLLQNALHAGSLVASQPGITLADPAVAVLWGVLVFGETTRGGVFVAVAVLAAVVVGASTVALAGSPLLQSRERADERPDRSRRPVHSGAAGGAGGQADHAAGAVPATRRWASACGSVASSVGKASGMPTEGAE